MATRIAPIILLFLIAACGSSPGAGGPADGGAAPAPSFQTVLSFDGRASLAFDPADLPPGIDPDSISIVDIAPPAIAGARVVVAYEFQPDGVQFFSPARLTISLSGLLADDAGLADVRIAAVAGGAIGEVLETTVDATAQSVGADIQHFSAYGAVVFEDADDDEEEDSDADQDPDETGDEQTGPDGEGGNGSDEDLGGDGGVGDDEGDPPPIDEDWGTTYHVRIDGGSAEECTGLADAPYPGAGTNQPCAWSHPFIAFPPGEAPRIAAGDRLIIGPGSYRMGLGTPGADACEWPWSYDCVMARPPSGPGAAHPTRIYGQGWDAGCSNAPELFGAERPWQVIDLSGRSDVRVRCLEITDRSPCIEHHTGDLTCVRDAPPFGDWASAGIFATDSSRVLLADLDIHGLANTGIHAGRIADWTLERVRIAHNGWVGWDGDVSGDDGNSGTIAFRRVTIEWNGCSEDDAGDPIGCWAQGRNGYGDGLGTGSTGGNWIFEDSAFRHNTSDGLDLLYHDRGGYIVLDRVVSEGNAGNQVKLMGDAVVRNASIVGDCDFFQGRPYSLLEGADHCRGGGSPVSFSFVRDSQVAVVNSSIRGGVVSLVQMSTCADDLSGGERVAVRNAIFAGDASAPYLIYNQCPGVAADVDFSVISGTRDPAADCAMGAHNICADPLLGPAGGMVPGDGSPAIDAGLAVGSRVGAVAGLAEPWDLVPDVDIAGAPRPLGAGVDIGAYER